MKTFIQARLSRGNHETTVWIENKNDVQIGSSVEFKDTGEFWKVEDLYLEMDAKRVLENQKMNKSFGLSIK